MSGPENTEKKQRSQNAGRFQQGVSGNPHGRPRGARNKTTIAAEALLDQEAESLTRLVIKKALKGNMVALRLCLDRVMPVKRERTLTLQLPPLIQSQDGIKAIQQVIAEVAAGNITPEEGHQLTTLIGTWLKGLETLEFAERLTALEEQLAPPQKEKRQ